MEHKAAVEPIRVPYFNEYLQVEARKVIGFRAVCSCGWRSKRHPTYRIAAGVKGGHLSEVNLGRERRSA